MFSNVKSIKVIIIVSIVIFVLGLCSISFYIDSLNTLKNQIANIKIHTNVTNVIITTYKTRTDVNDFIRYRYNDAIEIEKIYEFYNQYTKNQNATFWIISKALKYKVPVNLFFALAYTESRFKPHAKNKNRDGSWDYGLFQLNSSTFRHYIKKYDVDSIMKIENNTERAGKFLNDQYKRYGNWIEATLAYNAGNTKTIKNGTVKHQVILDRFERMIDKEFNETF